MRRPTLAVVAICRNEEADLPAFLEHLLPWVDEIVLVDEFSTDRTVELACAAGGKVRVIQRMRDSATGFAGQRNAGISEARSDWLLHADIDFRVPPELAYEILAAINEPGKNAFRFRLQDFFLHRPVRGGGPRRWNQPWLARNGYCRFESFVHEKCIIAGGPQSIGQLQHRMWHLNDDGYSERLRKSMQYCHLEAEKLLRSGRRVWALDFVLQPLLVIAKRYLRDAAWRDGLHGFIATLHAADATFRAYALAWDRQHRIERDTLEQKVRDAWRAAPPPPEAPVTPRTTAS